MTHKQHSNDWKAARESYKDDHGLGESHVMSATNRFLVMDFWEFAIISTLMIAFFPWSLLFCLFVYGMEETKLLVLALLHDWVKTILAVLAILIPLAVVLVLLIVALS